MPCQCFTAVAFCGQDCVSTAQQRGAKTPNPRAQSGGSPSSLHAAELLLHRRSLSSRAVPCPGPRAHSAALPAASPLCLCAHLAALCPFIPIFWGGLLHQEVEFTGLEVASPTERNTLAFLGGRLLVTLISW